MDDTLTAAGERLHALARRMLRLTARLVPAGRRDEWRDEWESEVWHHLAAAAPRSAIGGAMRLLWRLAGALPHAALLRTSSWRLDMLRHDLRDALRSARRRPGFALMVIGTLSLGIGANTAMFTVVNSILIRPLPYAGADELVFAYGSFSGNPSAAISPPDFLDYRAQNRVFTSLAARTFPNDLVLGGGGGEPVRATGAAITADYFATLGVAPVHGRTFRPDEEQGGGHLVVVLSHRLWQSRYGGDPGVIGATILLDDRPLEIVGVMPRLADPTLDVDLWTPVEFGTPMTSVRRFHFLRAIGRLAPGVAISEAQAQLDVIAAQLAATYPENETWKLRLVPLRDEVVGDVGQTLVLLLGAVGLVLLIGCANLANLMLSRATARRGEIAIRAALGATRPRVVRQLLVESLVLSAAGGAFGLALAALAVQGLRLAAVDLLPRLAELRIDPLSFGFTAALSVGAGLLFGLVPALQTAPATLTASLATVGRGSGGSRRGQRARDALVVLQVAVSLVLAIGAGLLVRSIWHLQAVDPGFDSRGVVIADVLLPQARYPDYEAQRRFWREASERLAQVPGVSVAAAARIVPLGGGGDTYYWREGEEPATERARRNAAINSVTPGFFEAMGIPIVAGRDVGAAERAGGPASLVISEGMATQLFPGEGAIGKRLVVDFGRPWTAEVVGVVGDVLSYGPRNGAPDVIYLPADQHPAFGLGYVTLITRGAVGAAGLGRAIQSVVAGLDKDLPVGAIGTMTDMVEATTASDRLTAQVVAGFAAAALALVMIGLYGVLAYAVAQRTREIGIRLALGAPRLGVARLMVRRGLAVVTLGIAIGLPAAFLAMRAIQQLLFEVRPADPVVFAAVTAALLGAGLAACLLPARRAMRVDPRVALEAEG